MRRRARRSRRSWPHCSSSSSKKPPPQLWRGEHPSVPAMSLSPNGPLSFIRLEQREKVEQFRQQRAAALAEQRRLQQEQQEEASRRLHEEVEASKQRVVDRNTRLQQKEEDRRIAQEQKLAEEEMHRLKVLSMLAAEVRCTCLGITGCFPYPALTCRLSGALLGCHSERIFEAGPRHGQRESTRVHSSL